MNPLDVARLEREVALLIADYPELADDEDLRRDVIEGETDAFSVLTRIVRKHREAKAFGEAIKAERQALADRQERYGRRAMHLATLAARIMNAAGLTKAELPIATLSIRAGVPSVVITDEAAIPDDFCALVRTPSKTAIKDALTNGQTVPGAMLSNGAPSIAIRVK